MKILAIICEFNPFHNGHKYLLETARNISGADFILCIMSGNFTQRGEMCILDKYTRAKHAILGGADCVIQLPTPFAVAPAEIFAMGAVKILSSIPEVTTLAFGCEDGDKKSFIDAAQLLTTETDKFKSKLKEMLDNGESYIKSYAASFEVCGGDRQLVANPNNILGLEYTKAITRANANIEILPIKRIGAGYNDSELKENYSSASAIRQNLNNGDIKNNLPEFVYDDLKYINYCNEFDSMLRHSLFKSTPESLKHVYGCAEGLENKLKSLENLQIGEIIEKATSKRYSSSRIRRILCANALELYQYDCEKFLSTDLYIKPLAVKKQSVDNILSSLSKSKYPVVTRIDTSKLNRTAQECFEKDKKEFSQYNFLTHSDKKDYMIIV